MAYKIALIFTENMSLKVWSESGVIGRDSLLYERLAEEGHAITFVTYGGARDAEYLPPNSRIRVLSRPQGVSKRAYARRLASIHGPALADVDLIKSHQFRGARHAARLARKLHKPLLVRAGYLASVFAKKQDAGWKRRWTIFLDECLASHSARLICLPGADDRDYLARRYLVPRGKIHTQPNAVDTEVFRPLPELRRPEKTMVFVGRLVPQKQPECLLEIARRIPDAEILIVGDGALRESMESTAGRENLKLNFLGRIANEEMPRVLNSAQVFFLPTTHEGSPKALYEAMACGLPVVSTNVVGVAPAFQPGVEGMQLDPSDIEGMTRGLEQLLNDPALARSMGQKARERALAHFSFDRLLDHEKELYRIVLARD